MDRKIVPFFTITQHCDKATESIKVSTFDAESCVVAEFDENHRHEYYEIIWLKKGKGIHTIDTIHYPYAGSVLFLLSPGQMHHINPSEKAEGYVVKFLQSLFTDVRDINDYLLNVGLFDNIQAQPILKVSSSGHAIFEDVLSKMDREFNADEVDKEKILVAYLKILLTHIARIKEIIFHRRRQPLMLDLFFFRNIKLRLKEISNDNMACSTTPMYYLCSREH